MLTVIVYIYLIALLILICDVVLIYIDICIADLRGTEH